MDGAVDRAIKCMWAHYDEPLSLSDVARSAILSRFHFSRVFRDATGVTPGRFLSAVRIYQAKRMLLTTSMNITDISFAVGYSSLGSFTNHFTDSVGVSPGRFRRISQNGGFNVPQTYPVSCPLDGTVAGTVTMPSDYATARVYLGAFDTPIMQRQPCCATITDIEPGQPVPYRLGRVPAGTWFIHAAAVADTIDPEPWTRRSLLVGGHSAVTVTAGAAARAMISLRPRRPSDVPTLLALPDLEPQRNVYALPGAVPVAQAELM